MTIRICLLIDMIQSQVESKRPSAIDIDTILRPWTILQQRLIATHPSILGNIWIRTCYDEGSNSHYTSLVEQIDIDFTVNEKERILSNRNLDDFGDDWQQLFEIMPDLIRGKSDDSDLAKDRIRKAEDCLVKMKALSSGETIEDTLQN